MKTEISSYEAEKKFREQCIERINSKLDCNLIKNSRTRGRASYVNKENNIEVVCPVSKEHKPEGSGHYWFDFHLYQKDILLNCKNGYLGLGCGSEKSIILIPIEDLTSWLGRILFDKKRDKYRLHIYIGNDEVFIRTLKESKSILPCKYLIGNMKN